MDKNYDVILRFKKTTTPVLLRYNGNKIRAVTGKESTCA